MVRWDLKVTKANKETQETRALQVNKEDQVLLVDQGDQGLKVKWDQQDFPDQLEEMGYLGVQAFLDHQGQLEILVKMETKAKLDPLEKKVSKGVKAQWVLLDPLAHEVLLETKELKGQLETRVCAEKWDDKEQKEKMDLWV